MIRLFKNITQRFFPYGVFRKGKAVYLTFDDGPIPEVTPKLLEILDRYGVKATFFMVGENIDKHPEVFEQVVKAGHTIGNHTYNHLKGWDYSLEDYLANVAKWHEAVARHLPKGYSAPEPLRFRPPYGKATYAQRKALHKQGYEIVFWDVLTQDYNPTKTPAFMLRRIQRETRAGSIINFHDSLKSNERMLEVMPQVIEWLQKEGYEIRGL